MPTFTVLRRVDAFVDFTAIVEAGDEEEAAVLARQHEEDYNWRKDGVVTFDAREYVTLTTSGDELDHTRVGDF